MKVNLREDVTYQPPGANLRLDRDRGIVYGCKFLGMESRNGRRYLPESTTELSLYEGAKSNLDHSEGAGNPSRSVKDRFGRAKNVVRKANGEVWGEFHYNPRHSFAPAFEWWVENDPGAIGFSHNAEGDGDRNRDTGLFEVRKVTRVHSIDLVADPATTKGLAESQQGRPMKLREWNEKANVPAPVRKLIEDDMGMGDIPAPADAPAEGMDSDEAAWQAFRTACIAVLDDENHDAATVAKKIGGLLKSYEKHMGGEKESSDDSGSDSEPPETKESADAPDVEKLLRENDELRAQIKGFVRKEKLGEERARVKRLAISAGLREDDVTAVFLDNLMAQPDDKSRQTLIEDRRATVMGERVRKPVSAAPGTPVKEDKQPDPDKLDAQELADFVKGMREPALNGF